MDINNIREETKQLREKLTDIPLRFDTEVLIPTLAELISFAVRKCLANKKNPAIAFSGGVDSTLIAFIAKQANPHIKLYNASVGNAHDKEWAEKIARHFSWDVTYGNHTPEEAEKIIHIVMTLVPNPNVVSIGVACPEYVVMSLAQEDGCDVVLGGLGSEEIFAGYERHKEADDVHDECWKGLAGLYERDIVRDVAISKHFGIPWACPFLDKKVVTYAMHIAPELKISETEKKIILRKVAVHMGLPEAYAYRPKKAAQYGSGFDKILGKLAKAKGLQKHEYITYVCNSQNRSTH